MKQRVSGFVRLHDQRNSTVHRLPTEFLLDDDGNVVNAERILVPLSGAIVHHFTLDVRVGTRRVTCEGLLPGPVALVAPPGSKQAQAHFEQGAIVGWLDPQEWALPAKLILP